MSQCKRITLLCFLFYLFKAFKTIFVILQDYFFGTLVACSQPCHASFEKQQCKLGMEVLFQKLQAEKAEMSASGNKLIIECFFITLPTFKVLFLHFQLYGK